jgi:probable F420-dependent oxidoreductase
MDVVYGFPFHGCPAPPYLLDGGGFTELARTVEAAGFAGAHLTDHPAPSQAWRDTGGHDSPDPFVGLAFAAAATTRLRLLTYLAVLPYRNPFHLAKTVASLDALSGGRVELGLGAGYLKSEFRALGVDWDERNALFDEAVDILRRAWTGEPVTHQGRHFSARATVVQPPCDPRLWLGGNSALTLRRVVDLGTGWLPLPNPRATAAHLHSPAMETIEDFRALLDRAAAYGGRPLQHVMYPLPGARDESEMKAHIDLAHRARDAGATAFVVNGLGDTLPEARAWIARYADTVLPHL